jgi:cobalamin biosynthesis protein CbiD
MEEVGIAGGGTGWKDNERTKNLVLKLVSIACYGNIGTNMNTHMSKNETKSEYDSYFSVDICYDAMLHFCRIVIRGNLGKMYKWSLLFF